MEITLEINEWGFGLYAPWFGFDFAWGFVAFSVVAFIATKFIRKTGVWTNRKAKI